MIQNKPAKKHRYKTKHENSQRILTVSTENLFLVGLKKLEISFLTDLLLDCFLSRFHLSVKLKTVDSTFEMKKTDFNLKNVYFTICIQNSDQTKFILFEWLFLHCRRIIHLDQLSSQLNLSASFSSSVKFSSIKKETDGLFVRTLSSSKVTNNLKKKIPTYNSSVARFYSRRSKRRTTNQVLLVHLDG